MIQKLSTVTNKVTEDSVAVPKKKVKIPKPIVQEDHLDYSHLYSSFFDIFVGHQTDPK